LAKDGIWLDDGQVPMPKDQSIPEYEGVGRFEREFARRRCLFKVSIRFSADKPEQNERSESGEMWGLTDEEGEKAGRVWGRRSSL